MTRMRAAISGVCMGSPVLRLLPPSPPPAAALALASLTDFSMFTSASSRSYSCTYASYRPHCVMRPVLLLESGGVVEMVRTLVVGLYVCAARSVKLNWLRCVSSSSSSAWLSVLPSACAASCFSRRASCTVSRKFLSYSVCAAYSSLFLCMVRAIWRK